MHAEQRRARLDLVGRATSDGAAHVLGAIPPHGPKVLACAPKPYRAFVGVDVSLCALPHPVPHNRRG